VLGLVICPEKRGLGIGSSVLLELDALYAPQANWIELQVHVSNHAARRLYERLGYRVVNDCQDDGFLHMRKALRKQDPHPGGKERRLSPPTGERSI
jgi:ribosomal protein S18 acetylase RimI-like enzyme